MVIWQYVWLPSIQDTDRQKSFNQREKNLLVNLDYIVMSPLVFVDNGIYVYMYTLKHYTGDSA
jgi:hypothetical protein